MLHRAVLVTGIVWTVCASGACAQDDPKPPPLTREQLEAKANQAIAKGLSNLHGRIWDKLHQQHELYEIGFAAFVAWTLLESKVPPTDAKLQSLIRLVRQRSLENSTTYNIAAAIIMLDRLDDPRDQAQIELLSLRLVLGQHPEGVWNYNCSPISVKDYLKLVGTPPGVVANPGKEGPRFRIAPGLKKILEEFQPTRRIDDIKGDMSNTQFALMALWAAHRRGIPVEKAILRSADHLRKVQHASGGWSYQVHAVTGFPSIGMTSAAVLGLAMEQHIKFPNDTDKALDDEAIRAGLHFLGSRLAKAPDANAEDSAIFSALCLERTASFLGLRTINGIDWYEWGARWLVETQKPEGDWVARYGDADLCSALLFLRKVNIRLPPKTKTEDLKLEFPVPIQKKSEKKSSMNYGSPRGHLAFLDYYARTRTEHVRIDHSVVDAAGVPRSRDKPLHKPNA